MALPEIVLPSDIPPFTADSYNVEFDSLFADVTMTAGHRRKRRMFLTAPRVVSVQLDLSNAQMATFDQWFEVALVAGERQFSAQFAPQGPGALEWWAAQWMTPYEATPDLTGRWQVTGKLILSGSASATAPALTGLALSVSMALLGNATVSIPLSLAVSVSFPLGAPTQQFAFSSSMALLGLPSEHSAVLRGDDETYLLYEDGTRIGLE